MHLRSLFATIAICLVASVGAAAAADPKPGPTRKALSRAALRACLDRQSELNQTSGRLSETMTQHDATLDSLGAEAAALSEILRTIDASDERAVDAYNKRNEERNVRVEKVNKHAEALNAALEAHRRAIADFMAECASRPYLKADEEALLRERGQQRREPLPADPRSTRKSRPVTI